MCTVGNEHFIRSVNYTLFPSHNIFIFIFIVQKYDFLRFYWAKVKSWKSSLFFTEFWWNGNVQIATVWVYIATSSRRQSLKKYWQSYKFIFSYVRLGSQLCRWEKLQNTLISEPEITTVFRVWAILKSVRGIPSFVFG